eukprot:539539-Rhodomonas_salina.2
MRAGFQGWEGRYDHGHGMPPNMGSGGAPRDPSGVDHEARRRSTPYNILVRTKWGVKRAVASSVRRGGGGLHYPEMRGPGCALLALRPELHRPRVRMGVG